MISLLALPIEIIGETIKEYLPDTKKLTQKYLNRINIDLNKKQTKLVKNLLVGACAGGQHKQINGIVKHDRFYQQLINDLLTLSQKDIECFYGDYLTRKDKKMNGKINNCAKKIEKDPHKYDEYLPKVIKLHHQEMVYMWCLLGLLTAVAIAVVFDIIMNGISALDYSFFILMAANVAAIFLLAHQRKTTPEMLKPAINTIKQMHLIDYNKEQQEILKELLIISCVAQKERQALEILQTSNNKEIIDKLYRMFEEDIDKINKI